MITPVGADIESICGKCGDVWHVVVAKVADRIAKVQCKQCGKQHRHKPPGGTTVRAARRSSSKAGTKSRAKSVTKAQPASNEPLIPPNLSRPVRAYGISEKFEVGDRVEHRKFGLGVVELAVGQGKIQVFFGGGRRVLAHER